MSQLQFEVDRVSATENTSGERWHCWRGCFPRITWRALTLVRGEESLDVPGKALSVPVSGNFHRKLFRHHALAVWRVVFRKTVGANKCEQRKTGENRDEYPDQFPFHVRQIERVKFTFFLLWKSRVRDALSALHIGELCGYFSISYRKDVNAAQVPWLTVAHLAIDP